MWMQSVNFEYLYLIMRFFVPVFGCFILLILCQCKDTAPNTNNYIPEGPVSLVVNTDLPEYYTLKNPGNYVYLSGGHRGVLVMHTFDDNFVALERTCSFEPDNTCSKIYVDSTKATLRCGTFNLNKWEPCCQSRFQYNGLVTEGPAQFNLRTYLVSVNGSTLTIRN